MFIRRKRNFVWNLFHKAISICNIFSFSGYLKILCAKPIIQYIYFIYIEPHKTAGSTSKENQIKQSCNISTFVSAKLEYQYLLVNQSCLTLLRNILRGGIRYIRILYIKANEIIISLYVYSVLLSWFIVTLIILK